MALLTQPYQHWENKVNYAFGFLLHVLKRYLLLSILCTEPIIVYVGYKILGMELF